MMWNLGGGGCNIFKWVCWQYYSQELYSESELLYSLKSGHMSSTATLPPLTCFLLHHLQHLMGASSEEASSATLNGRPKWRGKFTWWPRNLQIFPPEDWMAVLSASVRQQYCFAVNLSSKGRSHIGSLFIKQDQKKAGSWCNTHCCYTCRPCSWDCIHRMPDTKWQHSLLCFCYFQKSTISKLAHKSSGKLLSLFFNIFFYIPFLLTGLMKLLCLGVPFNSLPLMHIGTHWQTHPHPQTSLSNCPGLHSAPPWPHYWLSWQLPCCSGHGHSSPSPAVRSSGGRHHCQTWCTW